MKQIMVRHAEDDFNALLIASGMAKAGAEVFCITNNGLARPRSFAGHVEDYDRRQKFLVWARVRNDTHCDECDKEIDKCLNEQKP